MRTVTKGFHARVANRPFLVFDFRALAFIPERQSVSSSKTKNGRLATTHTYQLPSSPWAGTLDRFKMVSAQGSRVGWTPASKERTNSLVSNRLIIA